MQRARALLLILLVLAAGCTGAPQAKPEGGSDAPSRRDALRGWILDPSLAPLIDVNVTIHGTNESTRTDSSGLYRFASAPRATPIVVVAELAGFLTSSKGITVPEDEGAVLNFTLDPVPVKEPHKTVAALPGFLSCQTFLVLEQEERLTECGSTDTNNKPRRDFSMQQDVAGVVLELVWEAATPLAETLNLTVETVNLGDQDRVLGSAAGASPLRVQVSEQAARRFYANGGIARLIVSAGAEPDEDEASVGASVAIQQGFTVHVTVFYVAPPPPTYTALVS